MKKDLLVLVFKILGTGCITLGSFFGYVDEEKQVYEKPEHLQDNKIIEVAAKEEVIENNEEIEEPVQEVMVTTPEKIAPVVTEPVVEIPKIDGNKIEIPGIYENHLMKDTTGEHFFLNHNINGVYDGIGVPYVDFRHDFTDIKTILYGHSSTAGNGPFQVLQNYYNNPSFFFEHPIINITYNGVHYSYQIFSVYVSLADNEQSEGLEFYHRMTYTPDEWESTLQKYKSNSLYDTGISVNRNDKILILQTCSMDPNYYAKYYRYNLLIMAKLVSVQ